MCVCMRVCVCVRVHACVCVCVCVCLLDYYCSVNVSAFARLMDCLDGYI